MKRTPEAKSQTRDGSTRPGFAEVGRFTLNTDSGEQRGAVKGGLRDWRLCSKKQKKEARLVIMVLSLGPLQLKAPAERAQLGKLEKNTGMQKRRIPAKGFAGGAVQSFSLRQWFSD